jgi:hypothetical protein
MKRFVLASVLAVLIIGSNFADENEKNGSNLYTFFVNIVNEQFRFPLVGFVNIADGDHNSPQIGFINWNQNNFKTLQMGFVNTIGGDMGGFQLGFVNTIGGENAGGLQMGFVNTSVNKFSGAQISFVNVTKQLKGLQLGFINYADSVEEGIPIGFLSIVRNGGYKAIELGVSEISPFNLSFKIGLEKFYTSFTVAYNPFKEGIREQIILGSGLGTIIRIGKTFFFNPEIIFHNSINGNFQNYTSFVPYFGYRLMSNLSIIAGPSIVWTYSNNNEMQEPFVNILKYDINERHKLFLGGRIAVRIHW